MPDIRPVGLFIPEIKLLIQQKNFEELKTVISEINTIDLADGLTDFPPEQQLLIWKLLPPSQAIEVFEELDLPQQEYFIQHLEDETLSPLLEGFPPEVTANLFKKLPEKIVRKMARLMKKERVEIVRSVMEFPPNSAGSEMQTEFVPIHPDMTAKAALERLQACARLRKGGFLHHVYVVNENNKLLGGISLRSLISAPSDIKIRMIMKPVSTIKIPAKMDQEEASKIFSRYKLITAPVIDEDNRLIGCLTAENMFKVIQEEDTEDIQKLAGVEALDQPYFQIAFSKMIKKRATWLLVLFISEMLTATAMGFFEKEIARAVVLALFIPLIISSGGNSGSQAATLIVRAMALKEVNLNDWWRVMKREFFSGLTLGAILGAMGFARIFIWSQFSDFYGPHYFLVALTVGFALILIVMWGTLAGSLLPMFLRRIKLDPAVASAPFVATLVDVTGIVFYFGIAIILLRGALL